MKACFINGYNSLNHGQQMFHGANQLGARLNDEGVAIWEEGRSRNHIVFSPENMVSFNEADILIYIDWRIRGQSEDLYYEVFNSDQRPKYLLKREVQFWNPVIPSYNDFGAVFTFEEALSHQNTFESNYCIDVSQYTRPTQIRDLECSLVSTNHNRNEDGCLYSYRREAAKFLSKNLGSKFEVYGRGWAGENVNFKGACNSKADILSRSVFNLCTENYSNVQGYVTEKLLESVFYGSIPVYYCEGHSTKKVPRDVFVNCAGVNPEDLTQHLSDILVAERERLREAGREWLLSEAFRARFDSRNQAKIFWDILESRS